MSNYTINHLRELESEAIFVIREVAAQFEKPALLFSGGKDSILMTHLAKKAFFPAPFFPKTPKNPPYGKFIETLLTTVLLPYVFDKFFVLIDVFGT